MAADQQLRDAQEAAIRRAELLTVMNKPSQALKEHKKRKAAQKKAARAQKAQETAESKPSPPPPKVKKGTWTPCDDKGTLMQERNGKSILHASWALTDLNTYFRSGVLRVRQGLPGPVAGQGGSQ